MKKIFSFILKDLLRNKFLIIYTVILSILTWTVFLLEDDAARGLLTIINLVLLSVPLVSVIFSTTYLYNRIEFNELLLSHPVQRSVIWQSQFGGLVAGLSFAFIFGAGLPILVFIETRIALLLIFTGTLITTVFVSLSFTAVIFSRDKARGVGISIAYWLFFTYIFEGLFLMLILQLSDYQLEGLVTGMIFLNPLSLARVLILIQMDITVMLGYSGAVFKEAYGTFLGMVVTFVALILWGALPFIFSLNKFNKMDL